MCKTNSTLAESNSHSLWSLLLFLPIIFCFSYISMIYDWSRRLPAWSWNWFFLKLSLVHEVLTPFTCFLELQFGLSLLHLCRSAGTVCDFGQLQASKEEAGTMPHSVPSGGPVSPALKGMPGLEQVCSKERPNPPDLPKFPLLSPLEERIKQSGVEIPTIFVTNFRNTFTEVSA